MTTVRFADFIIELEDRTTPGTFNRPCGITGKGFERTTNTSEAIVPNCDDEGAPGEIQRGVVSLDWSVDDTMTIDLDDQDDWEARYAAGEEVNVRISRPNVGVSGGSGNYVAWTGPAIITKFSMNSEFGAKGTTGAITLTAAGSLVHSTYTRS